MNFKDFYNEYEKLHDKAHLLNKKSSRLQITVSIRVKTKKKKNAKKM